MKYGASFYFFWLLADNKVPPWYHIMNPWELGPPSHVTPLVATCNFCHFVIKNVYHYSFLPFNIIITVLVLLGQTNWQSCWYLHLGLVFFFLVWETWITDNPTWKWIATEQGNKQTQKQQKSYNKSYPLESVGLDGSDTSKSESILRARLLLLVCAMLFQTFSNYFEIELLN